MKSLWLIFVLSIAAAVAFAPVARAVCGDGIIDGGEQCDDGNLVDGDGCSSVCRLECIYNSSCVNVLANGDMESYPPSGVPNLPTGYANYSDEFGVSYSRESSVVHGGSYSIDIYLDDDLHVNNAVGTIYNYQQPVQTNHDFMASCWMRIDSDETPTNHSVSVQLGITASFGPPGSLGTVWTTITSNDNDGQWMLVTVGPASTAAPNFLFLVIKVSENSIPASYHVYVDDCFVYNCSAPWEPCITCGDGVFEPGLGEECDDNNTVGGDGCSANCTAEDGWDCSGGTTCEKGCLYFDIDTFVLNSGNTHIHYIISDEQQTNLTYLSPSTLLNSTQLADVFQLQMQASERCEFTIANVSALTVTQGGFENSHLLFATGNMSSIIEALQWIVLDPDVDEAPCYLTIRVLDSVFGQICSDINYHLIQFRNVSEICGPFNLNAPMVYYEGRCYAYAQSPLRNTLGAGPAPENYTDAVKDCADLGMRVASFEHVASLADHDDIMSITCPAATGSELTASGLRLTNWQDFSGLTIQQAYDSPTAMEFLWLEDNSTFTCNVSEGVCRLEFVIPFVPIQGPCGVFSACMNLNAFPYGHYWRFVECDGSSWSNYAKGVFCEKNALFGCGNGVVDPGEECDDGNLIPLDGCDAQCHIECLTRQNCTNVLANGGMESGDGFPTGWSVIANYGGSWTRSSSISYKGTWSFCLTIDDDQHGNDAWVRSYEQVSVSNGTNYFARCWLRIDSNEAPTNHNVFVAIVLSDTFSSLISPSATNEWHNVTANNNDGVWIQISTDEVQAISSSMGFYLVAKENGNPYTYTACFDECEVVYNCTDVWEPCPQCGDGSVDPGEECDDGNLNGGDGCSSNCTVEPCWYCDQSEPSDCKPLCVCWGDYEPDPAVVSAFRHLHEVISSNHTLTALNPIDYYDGIASIFLNVYGYGLNFSNPLIDTYPRNPADSARVTVSSTNMTLIANVLQDIVLTRPLVTGANRFRADLYDGTPSARCIRSAIELHIYPDTEALCGLPPAGVDMLTLPFYENACYAVIPWPVVNGPSNYTEDFSRLVCESHGMQIIDAPELNTQELLTDGLQNVYWMYVSSLTTVHTGLRLDNWQEYAGKPAADAFANSSNVFHFSWYDSGAAFSCTGNQSDCPVDQDKLWGSNIFGPCVNMQTDILGSTSASIWKFENCTHAQYPNYADAVICERPPITPDSVERCGRDCVKMCPALAAGSNRCVHHLFRDLEELDSAGNRVPNRNVPGHSAVLHNAEVSSTSASTNGHVDSFFDVDYQFLLDWITPVPAEFVYSIREEIATLNGVGKLNLTISGWPFASMNNSLRLQMVYRFPGADSLSTEPTPTDTGCRIIAHYSGVNTTMEFYDQVFLDSSVSSTTLTSFVCTKHKGFGWFSAEIPYFTSEASYEPVVYF